MKKRKLSISPKLQTHKKAGPETRHIYQVGRNDSCPCGSGRKYKDCHEPQGEAYLKKLTRQQSQARLKKQGVPWWKRWLFFYK